ncbi:MAG: BCCT family transporter [Brevinema sp.]
MKTIFSKYFIITSIITGLFALWSIIFPERFGSSLSQIQIFFAVTYGWFIKIFPVLILGICLYISFTPKYGRIKFGGEDSIPEFSTFSWLTMLFTAGIGVGIVYFAINEGIYGYFLAPDGIASGITAWEAGKNAMGIAIYHWGISTWAIFSISGLCSGYFTFRHNTQYLPGAPIAFAFSQKPWAKYTAHTMNILAIICSALTISATIGLGSIQIATGARIVFNVSSEQTFLWPYYALIILYIIFLGAALTPLNKGMNFISNINIWLCIILLLFVMIFGPTRYIFEQIFNTLGMLINWLIPKNFEMYIFAENPRYTVEWDTSSLLWWLAWTPFMGVFIASISKGRTIKEFCIATISIPVLFMILWIATFSGIALLNVVEGSGDFGDLALAFPEATIFALLDTLPFSYITSIVALLLIIFFLATTCTSAAITLSRMTDKNGVESHHFRTFLWATFMSTIAFAAIFNSLRASAGAESLQAFRSLSTVIALPYLFFFLVTISAFIKQLRWDNNSKGG